MSTYERAIHRLLHNYTTVELTRSRRVLYLCLMEIDKGIRVEFRLDPASGVPTYLQLVQQVEHALRLGYLKPGDQLPKVRDVVASLAINPNTVLKAYRELETKGLAAGRPGQGTFIEATLSQVALPELAALRRSLLGWLAHRRRRPGWTRTGSWRCSRARCGISMSAATAARQRRGGGRRMNVVEASGLGKRYGGTWALRECSLAIPAGHVAALVGPNGAGKTHAAEPGGRPGGAVRGRRHRARRPAAPGRRPRWTASRSSPRTRRCTRTCRPRTCCT